MLHDYIKDQSKCLNLLKEKKDFSLFQANIAAFQIFKPFFKFWFNIVQGMHGGRNKTSYKISGIIFSSPSLFFFSLNFSQLQSPKLQGTCKNDMFCKNFHFSKQSQTHSLAIVQGQKQFLYSFGKLKYTRQSTCYLCCVFQEYTYLKSHFFRNRTNIDFQFLSRKNLFELIFRIQEYSLTHLDDINHDERKKNSKYVSFPVLK